MRVVWRERRSRCYERVYEVKTYPQSHELGARREKLTTRAIGWAASELCERDIAVSVLAEALGATWNAK